ncbi:hypothetical protein [Arsenophonus apicola]|uniref:Arc-like DNA binding domain-containing protein n=1 Tax=Arsenophonus apicola TaxID=2879119 RepID=A0ABY8P0J5_9GAMM|nr:hypothetical protein [Arsenophonus apicola]WGO82355.1 hypothetical protein QG404_01060 [Arsenophonus apicola]
MKKDERPSPYPFRMKPEMREWLDAKAKEKRRSTQVQLEYILEIVKEKEIKGEFQVP